MDFRISAALASTAPPKYLVLTPYNSYYSFVLMVWGYEPRFLGFIHVTYSGSSGISAAAKLLTGSLGNNKIYVDNTNGCIVFAAKVKNSGIMVKGWAQQNRTFTFNNVDEYETDGLTEVNFS